MVERHRLTVDDLIRELEEARAAALHQEKPQAAAMVAAAHDDQVDAMTQAIRRLYPKNGPLKISAQTLALAAQRR